MSTAESTPEVQDPDSLEELGQEPEDVEDVEPVDDDAADPDEIAAEDDADSVGQPDDEGAAVEGQPRDEHGRFISPQATAPSGQPAAESSPPAATPSGTPFSFRVDGLAVDAEGAYEQDGRITMPREVWDRVVQPRVADRGRMQQVQERMQARVRTLEGEAEARENRFKAVLGKVDELFSDPSKLKAFAEQYEIQAPRFRLEIENELLKTQTKRHETERQSSQAEAEEAEFRQLAPSGLANAVDVVIQRIAPDAKGVDKQALVTELQGLWDANVPIFFRVQEGDGSGLDPTQHKWGVNLDLVARFAQPYVKLHQKTASAQQAAAVEAANRAATGKGPKAKAPPVAPAAGSPAPGGGEKYPTTREEYAEWRAKKSEEYNLPM